MTILYTDQHDPWRIATEGDKQHEWIHDASCPDCGARARSVLFPPHPLEPLPGGFIDANGGFSPTCRRCGRTHRTEYAGPRVATISGGAADEIDRLQSKLPYVAPPPAQYLFLSVALHNYHEAHGRPAFDKLIEDVIGAFPKPRQLCQECGQALLLHEEAAQLDTCVPCLEAGR